MLGGRDSSPLRNAVGLGFGRLPTTSGSGGKAIFLDRDGTINRNTHYLIRFEDFEVLPGVFEALRLFQSMGFRLFGASNQSGVARGYFSLEEVESLHRNILDVFSREGIRLEEIAYCPHHPEAPDPRYRLDCECRKPKPGMLTTLGRKHGLDLAQSFMIGDSYTDAQAGVNAGATGVWIHPGTAATNTVIGNTGQVDNPPNIKEFVSLLEFARTLREID